jgi:hypothetical protein
VCVPHTGRLQKELSLFAQLKDERHLGQLHAILYAHVQDAGGELAKGPLPQTYSSEMFSTTMLNIWPENASEAARIVHEELPAVAQATGPSAPAQQLAGALLAALQARIQRRPAPGGGCTFLARVQQLGEDSGTYLAQKRQLSLAPGVGTMCTPVMSLTAMFNGLQESVRTTLLPWWEQQEPEERTFEELRAKADTVWSNQQQQWAPPSSAAPAARKAAAGAPAPASSASAAAASSVCAMHPNAYDHQTCHRGCHQFQRLTPSWRAKVSEAQDRGETIIVPPTAYQSSPAKAHMSVAPPPQQQAPPYQASGLYVGPGMSSGIPMGASGGYGGYGGSGGYGGYGGGYGNQDNYGAPAYSYAVAGPPQQASRSTGGGIWGCQSSRDCCTRRATHTY